jgi:hypothetical protein
MTGSAETVAGLPYPAGRGDRGPGKSAQNGYCYDDCARKNGATPTRYHNPP